MADNWKNYEREVQRKFKKLEGESKKGIDNLKPVWRKAYTQAVSLTNAYQPESFENFDQKDIDESLAHEIYLKEVLEQSEEQAKLEKIRTEMLRKREIEEQMRKANEQEKIKTSNIAWISQKFKTKIFDKKDKDEWLAHEMYLKEVLEQSEQQAKLEKERKEMLQKREFEEQMIKAKEEENMEEAKFISKKLEEELQKEKNQLENQDYMLTAQELYYKNVIEPEQRELMAKFKEDINQRTHTLITQSIRTVVENKLEEIMASLKPTIETVVDKWLDRHKKDGTDKKRDECNLKGRFEGIEAKINGLKKVLDKINCKADNTKRVKNQMTHGPPPGEPFKLPKPLPKQDMTLDELRKYDGKGSDKRICIGILGKVYDCTKGYRLYGPEGTYGSLAGRDATRALATFDVGTIKEEWDDVSDLTTYQMSAVNEWMEQFSERYDYIGRLVRDVSENDDSIGDDLFFSLEEEEAKDKEQISGQRKKL